MHPGNICVLNSYVNHYGFAPYYMLKGAP